MLSSLTCPCHCPTNQKGSDDCGSFACAFATSLLLHQNPVNVVYDRPKLRQNFMKVIEWRTILPFPARSKREMRYSSSIFVSKLIDTYCICKLASVDESMKINTAMCDSCNDHFHATCVEIPNLVWEDESAQYIYPSCK